MALLLDGILVACALFALGAPDLSGAASFVTGARPSHDEAIAAVEVMLWAAVALTVLAHLRRAVRASHVAGTRWRRTGSRLVLLAGLVVFIGGVVHQHVRSSELCCGDPTEAAQLLP